MTLFRCSVLKKRNSNKFLDTPDEVYAVGEVLDEVDWPDHFKRTGGITSQGVTRFGPEGYDTWPLYASEKDDTTFYEFAYWKLKDWENELGMQTNASLIKLEFHPNDKPINVQTENDKDKILDISTYVHSHQWIKGLANIPESISYPSVRDPHGGGINFAVYEENAVSNFSFFQSVTMIILDEFNVEVIFPNKTKVTVKPIK